MAVTVIGFGCTGTIADMSDPFDDPSPPGSARTSGAGTATDATPTGGTPGVTAGTAPAAGSCRLLPRRIVKLTPAQITATLEALVPGAKDDAANLASTIALAPDEFSNSGRRLELPESHVEALMAAAEKVAARALQKMSVLSACLPAGLEDDACIKTFIGQFGARAFRRPLDMAETAAFWAFFAEQAKSYGRSAAVNQVVQAFLVSPNFLFRTELGAGQAGASTALTPHERASALSYFLTDGPPDGAITQSAGRGELVTKAQVEAQARRLLMAGASANRGLLRFFEETLRSEDVLEVAKDPKLFPSFSSGLAQAMAREPIAFIEQLLWKEDASFRKLYTADYSVVNAPLAKLYGVTTASVSNTTFERVMMPAGRRSGLLTQAGLLATHASATAVKDADIVHRGKFIRLRLLCGTLAPFPMVQFPARIPGQTSREYLEENSKNPGCAVCHSKMDPLGFALENYDAIGAWRDVADGKPVRAGGTLTDVEGGPKTFANAVELGRLMGDLPDAQRCLLGQLYAYASSRNYNDVDECHSRQVMGALETAQGNLLDAVAAIVAADDFLVRGN